MSTLPHIVATAVEATDRSLFQSMGDWANVEGTGQLCLLTFGIFAQTLFFCRWLLQWVATERRGESHVPVAFWWMSLAGATLLGVYFCLRGEPVGLLGQSVGWTVYTRNLYLIHKKKAAHTAVQGDG